MGHTGGPLPSVSRIWEKGDFPLTGHLEEAGERPEEKLTETRARKVKGKEKSGVSQYATLTFCGYGCEALGRVDFISGLATV